MALMRTADLVKRLFSTTFAPYGITLAQYNVLRILRGAGEEGLLTTEVADRLIERSPGVTRMMDRLEARGWVRRERPRSDRRCVVCRITEAGLALLTDTDEVVDRLDEEALRGLSVAEQRQLVLLLEKVRAPYLGE